MKQQSHIAWISLNQNAHIDLRCLQNHDWRRAVQLRNPKVKFIHVLRMVSNELLSRLELSYYYYLDLYIHTYAYQVYDFSLLGTSVYTTHVYPHFININAILCHKMVSMWRNSICFG